MFGGNYYQKTDFVLIAERGVFVGDVDIITVGRELGGETGVVSKV